MRPITVCPECGTEVSIWKRVCFGTDPHVEYRCPAWGCSWRGRRPNLIDPEVDR